MLRSEGASKGKGPYDAQQASIRSNRGRCFYLHRRCTQGPLKKACLENQKQAQYSEINTKRNAYLLLLLIYKQIYLPSG